ncbi:glutamyl-tRNA amidotransferase [candidate division WWE3 bacterium RIFCSPHIGHO2_01_FULL_48_15]|uniref:Glutamyl-tRNA amidotransferase n=1 Tax=candidate division WWE3 bacterium RIFCSPHIGHO2_01_FULL_48_15 TaxID=1802619 RepID=A0A1F4VAL4_UNCKA|nr:MAG: glutamyl-tRNA amidotransferase [candidate division WWE3 bacterium RIFCSPHIGHO2_01_FULL_48_15]
MDTLSKIKEDLITALKSGETFKAETLRYVIAAIHNAEIAKGKDAQLSEEELIQVLQKQVKQRQESIEAYQKGGRSDLAEKEQKESDLIKTYLPAQMSEEEIRTLAQEAVKGSGASGPADMGKVMAVLMPKVKGKADGATVSRIVRESLVARS